MCIRDRLPIELAHSADSELEDLFVYKYLTRTLQTFRYKSEIMQPARRIETKPARPKGPMIVCLEDVYKRQGNKVTLADIKFNGNKDLIQIIGKEVDKVCLLYTSRFSFLIYHFSYILPVTFLYITCNAQIYE